MDIEEIGTLCLDFSQESPKVTIRDGNGETHVSGYLKKSENEKGRRTEMHKLQQSMNNMAKMFQILTSKINVIEERVRYFEVGDTITMKE